MKSVVLGANRKRTYSTEPSCGNRSGRTIQRRIPGRSHESRRSPSGWPGRVWIHAAVDPGSGADRCRFRPCHRARPGSDCRGIRNPSSAARASWKRCESLRFARAQHLDRKHLIHRSPESGVLLRGSLRRRWRRQQRPQPATVVVTHLRCALRRPAQGRGRPVDHDVTSRHPTVQFAARPRRLRRRRRHRS